MIKKSNLIYFIFICSILFLNCDKRTDQQKLMDRIKENPDLVEEMSDSLDKIILSTVSTELKKEDLSKLILDKIGNQKIVNILSSDLTGDKKREKIVLLNDNNTYQIIISSQGKIIETKQLKDNSFNSSSIQINLGKLIWKLNSNAHNQIREIELIFFFNKIDENYYLISSKESVVNKKGLEPLNIQKDINYLIRQKSISCSLWNPKKNKIDRFSFQLEKDFTKRIQLHLCNVDDVFQELIEMKCDK